MDDIGGADALADGRMRNTLGDGGVRGVSIADELEQGKDVASIISAANGVEDMEEEEEEEDTAGRRVINVVAADELVRPTDAPLTRGLETGMENGDLQAAAGASREESVQQELKMLENLMLQELEVKRKLDASFQSKVAEEMSKSRAAIEEAQAREAQLKVRELELEVRLERQMREQNAHLTSASEQLTRQMGEAGPPLPTHSTCERVNASE